MDPKPLISERTVTTPQLLDPTGRGGADTLVTIPLGGSTSDTDNVTIDRNGALELEVMDGGIDTAQLADDSVTGDKLALPIAETRTIATDPMFELINIGTGWGARFQAVDAPALAAIANGAAAALWVNGGDGMAAEIFRNTDTASGSVVKVTQMHADNDQASIEAENAGTSDSIGLLAKNSGSGIAALISKAGAAGQALRVRITNAASTAIATFIETLGLGVALHVERDVETATASVVEIEQLNADNDQNALDVTQVGSGNGVEITAPGTSLKVNAGEVGVEIEGVDSLNLWAHRDSSDGSPSEPVAKFEAFGSNATASTVKARNDALGSAIEAAITNVNSTAAALTATTNGQGPALLVDGALTLKRTPAGTSITASVLDNIIGVTANPVAAPGVPSITITLYAAAAMPAGTRITIKDESGAAGASTHILRVAAAFGEAIEAGANYDIVTAYGAVTLYTDHVGAWYVLNKV